MRCTILSQTKCAVYGTWGKRCKQNTYQERKEEHTSPRAELLGASKIQKWRGAERGSPKILTPLQETGEKIEVLAI